MSSELSPNSSCKGVHVRTSMHVGVWERDRQQTRNQKPLQDVDVSTGLRTRLNQTSRWSTCSSLKHAPRRPTYLIFFLSPFLLRTRSPWYYSDVLLWSASRQPWQQLRHSIWKVSLKKRQEKYYPHLSGFPAKVSCSCHFVVVWDFRWMHLFWLASIHHKLLEWQCHSVCYDAVVALYCNRLIGVDWSGWSRPFILVDTSSNQAVARVRKVKDLQPRFPISV